MSGRWHAFWLWLVLTGMEVSWLCAWAAFVCSALGLPVCSPAQALAVYALAALVAVQTGGSRLWRASLHAVGLGGALAFTLSAALRAPSESLLPLSWLERASERSLLGFSVCALAGLLWLRGALDVRKEQSYPAVCARFDRSLFAMLALLLFQLLLRAHLTQPSTLPGLLGVPLLACGVCALALARNRHVGHKRVVAGVRGAGTLLSLLGGLVIVAAVSGVVLWPALHDASEAGYAGLYRVARPLAQAYADAVLYTMRLLRDSSSRPEIPLLERPPKPRGRIGSPNAPSEPVLSPELDTWGLLGLALGVLLSLWLARRWLLSRRFERRGGWLAWLLQCWLALRTRLSRMFRPAARGSEPLRLYLDLLRWGRQSGAAKLGSETPREYAARLARLSGLQTDIELIVSAFVAHAYGSQVSPASIRAARHALARLRAPRHWALRVKLWLVRQPQGECE